MAEDESPAERVESIISTPIQSSQPASQGDLKSPDQTPLDLILNQRHNHRNIVLRFSMWVAGSSLFVFFFFLALEIFVKLKVDPSMSFFNKYLLEVLSVAVFGQSFGIILIITRSLWDDKPYKELLFSKENNKTGR